jgi:hypothetical protein
LWSGIELLRFRRIDALSLLVLAGILLSLLAMLLGGSPRVLLMRESLLSGLFGWLSCCHCCLASRWCSIWRVPPWRASRPKAGGVLSNAGRRQAFVVVSAS